VSKKFYWAILLTTPAMAGEYAVFSSGLRIHIDRHEASSEVIRLYTKDGFAEVPANSVTSFEADDYVAPPPVPTPAPAPATPPPTPPDTKTMVRDAAARYALPQSFVESVAKVESAMKPEAISPKGAIGVMQLMPETARALSADPTDPEQNIDAGTHLLRDLLLKYDGDVVKALAAYNAGTGAVDKYQGLPPYSETQNYVDKVIQAYKKSAGQ
jgi:soluble lytic murein transglycosylase-like protein